MCSLTIEQRPLTTPCTSTDLPSLSPSQSPRTARQASSVTALLCSSPCPSSRYWPHHLPTTASTVPSSCVKPSPSSKRISSSGIDPGDLGGPPGDRAVRVCRMMAGELNLTAKEPRRAARCCDDIGEGCGAVGLVGVGGLEGLPVFDPDAVDRG